MPAQPTIASGAVAKLLATLPVLGLDPHTVCDEIGFDASACAHIGTDARVPLSVLHALWEVVIARVPRADLALVVADRYDPGDYGLVGFVAIASPSLGEALAQVARYIRLWTDEPGIHLHSDGRLELAYHAPLGDRPGLHRATEATLAELLHAARRVMQRHLVPREVRFRHPPPEPAGRDVFAAYFGAPVCFDAPTTEMLLSAEDLARPLPRMDAQLCGFLRQMASDALKVRGTPDALLDQMRRIIGEELPRGLPGVDVVARRIGMSGRTLRRRLEAEGTTFREVIDRTRAEMAESYVRDRRLPLSEVAFLLGFSEPSAFTRAFKRWTDSTPGAWRQRLAPRD